MAVVCLAAGCGSSSSPSSSGATSAAPVDSTEPSDSRPPSTTATHDADDGSGDATDIDAAALPPMDVVASLGYPRDLLDRGRVNVEISRSDDTDFVVLDKQLVADHFTPAPAEKRRSVLPPDGRVVALQTLLGDVDDCDSPNAVTASLDVTFTYGDDPSPRTTSIPFTDATTLDDIRLQKCTIRRVLAENEIAVRNPVVDGETMAADLDVTRREGERRLAFDSIKGTVLFGASTPFEPGRPERVLEPDETHAVIPLVLDVNRCDSHAVAETTRKFGIDLYVSVDGAESQRIEVPIEPIVGDLESMLESCKERTGRSGLPAKPASAVVSRVERDSGSRS